MENYCFRDSRLGLAYLGIALTAFAASLLLLLMLLARLLLLQYCDCSMCWQSPCSGLEVLCWLS